MPSVFILCINVAT